MAPEQRDLTPEPPARGSGAGVRRWVPARPQPTPEQVSARLAEARREAHAVDEMALLPAGPGLAATLADALPRLDRLTAAERTEVVAMADRVAAWAHHAKALAAASTARHPDLLPPREVTAAVPAGAALTPVDLASATLAMRLRTSRREAHTLVREGRAYRGVLAPTGDALARGEICPARARVLVRRLGDQAGEVAWAVQEAVLPHAPGRTAAQVARDVERALLLADPEDAADRHRRAARQRCVSRPRVLQDGMAGSWVVLPAARAVQVDAALDAAARRARAAGDGRTLDQLRADELVGRVLGADVPVVPVAAPVAVPGPDPSDGREATHDRSTTHDGDATHDRTTTHERSADHDRGAARDCSATHDRTTTHERSATHEHGAAPGPDGPIGSPSPDRSGRAHVLVTVPLTTLLGIDYSPGEVAGYGPVDAVQARALALGGTWRRLVTDPLSGAVLDVGRTRYRPPAALDEHVRARDRYCVAPGCLVPAAAADLDHTVRFPEGPTADTNLAPLCRHHHRLKHEGGFGLRQRRAGEFEWTTPTGHRFRTGPGVEHLVVHCAGSIAGPPAGAVAGPVVGPPAGRDTGPAAGPDLRPAGGPPAGPPAGPETGPLAGSRAAHRARPAPPELPPPF
ncbi:HNH endonuclease signature motif containing protein [Cellulomonas triticagri]|uniref:HNH endonuclease n=1 Tax=Cellulomonas triticagri TaxID=2483352 RepID=A0A3M2J9M5_9CELL|nr:HNH endonuclease signature motif containing protein [Cellulomonas triticagri]RMI09624.1 HNH endonuclease [Cellulomonas triticagri]